jgi:hypothetical protein
VIFEVILMPLVLQQILHLFHQYFLMTALSQALAAEGFDLSLKDVLAAVEARLAD